MSWHIEVSMIWPTSCRWSVNTFSWKKFFIDSNIAQVSSRGFKWQYFRIGSGNDTSPNRWQVLAMSQCWPGGMSPFGVTWPEWVNSLDLITVWHRGGVELISYDQNLWYMISSLVPDFEEGNQYNCKNMWCHSLRDDSAVQLSYVLWL